MDTDQIGTMHWTACKKCKNFDEKHEWCSFGTTRQFEAQPQFHVGPEEVICKTYEDGI